MKLNIILPHWFNNPNVPTVRKFYLMLLESLTEWGIDYDLIPDLDLVYAEPVSRLARLVNGKKGVWKEHDYSTQRSYEYVLRYHSKTSHPNAINIKISYLPDYFYFDKTGFSGWADIANTKMPFEELEFESATVEFQHIAQKYIQNNVSKYVQTSRMGEQTLPQPYVFLATQVEDDIVAELADVKTFELVKACLEHIPSIGYHLVIKRHPKCTSSRIEKLLREHDAQEKVSIVDYSIHDIIPQASAVIVVNSGVGFEALLHQKPVIAFGHSDYHWVTTRMKHAEELQKLPDIISNFSEEQRRAIQKFVVYYLQHYLVEIGNRESLKKALGRFNIMPRSLQ